MFKIFSKAAITIFLLTILLPVFSVRAEVLGWDNAYKGIVKIYTYYENSQYYLTAVQSGSGVIISDNGIILTNSHVVTVTDGFDNPVPVAFEICLTFDTTQKPDCSYSADLIAKDTEKDVALLRIRNIGLSAKNSFDYIERATNSNLNINDSVAALGYPGIGGDTISGSMGTIVGTTDKYSMSWIKTNSLISFGSSGGALVDATGKLIGITSMAFSDLLGSMGYAININSISSWINNNISAGVTVSPLQTRMTEIIKKENNLKTSNTFINTLPHVEVTKNSAWVFDYSGEDGVIIKDPQSPGGVLTISWNKSDTDWNGMMDTLVKDMTLSRTVTAQGDVSLAGKNGKKLIAIISGEEDNIILLSSKNYLITIDYWYGKDKADLSVIEQIKSTIKISDEGNNFTEQKSYQNSNPYFKIDLPSNWALAPRNSVTFPVWGETKAVPELGFSIKVTQLTESMRSLSNQDYFNMVKDGEVIKSDNEAAYPNLKGERYFESMDYFINNELPHEIFYKYRFKDENDANKVKTFDAGFRIRDNDKAIVIDFHMLGDNEALFDQYLADFQKTILINFTLGRQVSVPVATVTPTQAVPAATVVTPAPVIAPAPVMTPATTAVSSPTISIKRLTTTFARRLIGKVLLQVQDKFQAWYLSPRTWKAYFLQSDQDAYKILKGQGYTISNTSLAKIALGTKNLIGTDSDNDGLPDNFEAAIKTNPYSADSDNDGYADKTEIDNNYDPLLGNSKKLPINKTFTNYEKGRILLQYQGKNEMWYLNPADGKRYFISSDNVINTMRKVGLGISNTDFAKIK